MPTPAGKTPARRSAAASSSGAWITDVGERLAVPHKTGDYDHVMSSRVGGPTFRKQGLLHRLDGPAVVWQDGTELHYVAGKLHREDAPAVHGGPGGDEWWTHGVRVVVVSFDDVEDADDVGA
jgi:hypothetical protein